MSFKLVCVCLCQATASVLVTTVMSGGGTANVSVVVMSIKSDVTERNILLCSDSKTSAVIVPCHMLVT